MELKSTSNYLWNRLNSKVAENYTKEQQLKVIESVLITVYNQSKMIGKNSIKSEILKHLENL